MTVTLFRPVGLHELALIWDAGMKAFPPRLPHQPIFYPVANIDYATQIAKDWNTKDEASGFAGFVTQFQVPKAFLQNFEPQTVGASVHVEYWIPANSCRNSMPRSWARSPLRPLTSEWRLQVSFPSNSG